MRRKNERPLPPAALAALIVLAVAGVAAALRNRRGAGGTTTTKSGPEPWTCQCGQAFRVSGTGRHAVFWLAEADASDPVLDGACPSCGTPLPIDV